MDERSAIFVFEYVCGGGLAGQALPRDLVPQGRAMLRAVVDDLVAAGLTVWTTCDHRLDLQLAGAHVDVIESATACRRHFEQRASGAADTLVIAPESERILEQWSGRLKKLGARTLGCDLGAIRLCADKLATARHLTSAAIATPPTERACTWSPRTTSACRLVIKPRFGAGCERTAIFRPSQWQRPPETDLIVQPYVEGLSASISMLVHQDVVRLLPAGQQTIRRDGQRLTFVGVRLPLAEPLGRRCRALAAQVAAAVPGLNGFVGIDLVLAADPADDCVLEINPRLTVSYPALRAACRTNLALAILDPAAELKWDASPVDFDAAASITAA